MTESRISGGGLGGLALAHALRRGGLDVAVYERDPSPRLRNQGYRIHIDRDGNAALAACLPPEVLDLVRRTSGVSGDLVAATPTSWNGSWRRPSRRPATTRSPASTGTPSGRVCSPAWPIRSTSDGR
jgi:2-polyprenyl-6-methoxyphenol hydroxylase-like FAD-dependent oxidoreductase